MKKKSTGGKDAAKQFPKPSGAGWSASKLTAEETRALKPFLQAQLEKEKKEMTQQSNMDVLAFLRTHYNLDSLAKGSSSTELPESLSADWDGDDTAPSGAIESLKRKLKETDESLQQAKTELEALKTGTTAAFAADHDTPEPEKRMTLAQWRETEAYARKKALPQPRGLFDNFFEDSEDEQPDPSAMQDTAIVDMLEAKLQAANEKMELSKGVSVSKKAEEAIKKVASATAGKHFQTTDGLNLLKGLRDQYLNSRAQHPDTILTAILRACTSRKVKINDKELCLQ